MNPAVDIIAIKRRNLKHKIITDSVARKIKEQKDVVIIFLQFFFEI